MNTKYFSPKSFEALLFPLHKNVYHGIDKGLREIESRHPGFIEHIIGLWELSFHSATTESAEVSGAKYGVPIFDIYIVLFEKDLSRLRKSDYYETTIRAHEKEHYGKGMHLVVSVKGGKKEHVFIVPLQLLLLAFEERVCSPGSYQVYEHNLIRRKVPGAPVRSVSDYMKGSASYVGITKRPWQKRLREHQYASDRGSHLLFHRALRQELFAVELFEHIVLRAGLDAKSALRIEEIEVESRTFCDFHEGGLNMIPGASPDSGFFQK